MDVKLSVFFKVKEPPELTHLTVIGLGALLMSGRWSWGTPGRAGIQYLTGYAFLTTRRSLIRAFLPVRLRR